MRRLCATVLIMEAVVIGLAIPVAISVMHTDPRLAGIGGGGLAAAAAVLAALLRYRWAYYAATVLQVVMIATGVIVYTMFVLGVIFAALWILAIRLGSRVKTAGSR